MRIAFITVGLLAWCAANAQETQAPGSPPSVQTQSVFAVVDGVKVSTQDYNQALAVAIRQKFYHRQAPEGALAVVQQEVADAMINRILLLKEARRRAISPARDKVDSQMNAFAVRYRDSPLWEQMKGAVQDRLEEDSVLSQFEAAVRNVSPPNDAEQRGYYDSHRALFTEPEQVRLSVILLKVDPSSFALSHAERGDEGSTFSRSFGAEWRRHGIPASRNVARGVAGTA
jgi:hypothetical protein